VLYVPAKNKAAKSLGLSDNFTADRFVHFRLGGCQCGGFYFANSMIASVSHLPNYPV